MRRTAFFGYLIKVVFAFFVIFLPSSPGLAQDRTVFLAPNLGRINVTPYLWVYEDKGNRLTIQEIQALDAGGAFVPLEGSSGFGYSESGFWFKFMLANPTLSPMDWVLEYPYAVADHVEFHFPGKDGYQTAVMGDRHPVDKRTVDFRTWAVYQQTLPGRHTCYVKIATSGAVVATLNAWSLPAFNRYRMIDSAMNWFYFGIMASTIVYCLFIYFTLGDRAFLFLVVFVTGASLFTLAHTGMGGQYFWPGSPEWANRCHPFFSFLALSGGLLFSRTFLKTSDHSPFFDRIFICLTAVCVTGMAGSAFLPYTLLTQMSVVGIGITAIAMVSSGFAVLFKGVRQARFYLLAWSPFVVAALMMGFKSYGWVENNLLTDSLVQITPVFVTFLFVFGLVDKVNTYRIDREAVLVRLNQSEQQYRMLADNIKDVIWRLDLGSLKLTYITPSIEKVMGYSPDEAIRQFSFERMLPPEDYKRVMKIIGRRMKKTERKSWDETDFTIELQAYHKNGSLFWTETSTTFVRDSCGLAVEMIGVTRDITERKTAEKARKALEYQLHQSGKLEAMGTLAGGIAHDMNNIMAAVLGYAELCFQEAEQGTRMHHRLGRIINASHRARDLVRQILVFSRQESMEARPIKVSLILKEILSLIRASLPATITIETDFRDKDLVVNADPTQIHQIVMNLCSNAGYAMMDEGGVMGIVLEKAVMDGSKGAPGLDLSPGNYARLGVRDSGQGMTKEVLERIFDPFFTTKPLGQGTGLGLSMIHGIVKNMGGCIHVQSEPGVGSEFHVFLPLAVRDPQAQEGSRQEVPGGSERILYVDDESDILEMAEEMLSGLGYKVVVKRSGSEALNYLSVQREQADLLITDQAMPGMNGIRLVSEVRKILPGLKAILCTGYNEQFRSEAEMAGPGMTLLKKPYSQHELARKIREVLDQP